VKLQRLGKIGRQSRSLSARDRCRPEYRLHWLNDRHSRSNPDVDTSAAIKSICTTETNVKTKPYELAHVGGYRTITRPAHASLDTSSATPTVASRSCNWTAEVPTLRIGIAFTSITHRITDLATEPKPSMITCTIGMMSRRCTQWRVGAASRAARLSWEQGA
jgi:hypothetical protein